MLPTVFGCSFKVVGCSMSSLPLDRFNLASLVRTVGILNRHSIFQLRLDQGIIASLTADILVFLFLFTKPRVLWAFPVKKIICVSPQIGSWRCKNPRYKGCSICAYFVDPFCYLCFMSFMLSCLFLAALWSPAGSLACDVFL